MEIKISAIELNKIIKSYVINKLHIKDENIVTIKRDDWENMTDIIVKVK